MMNKNLVVILISILILFNLCQIIINQKQKRVQIKLQSLYQQIFSKVNYLDQNRQLNLELIGKNINTNMGIWEDNCVEIQLISLLKPKTNLILFIPQFSCSSCYEQIFKNFEKIGFNRNIIIISSFSNHNLLNNFRRINHIYIPIYQTSTENLLPIIYPENLLKPYFIEVSHKGKIISVQIIDSDFDEFMYEYLRIRP